MRAAELKDKKIQLIPYAPARAYRRKKVIEELCAELRNKFKNLDLRTNIRPGNEDFEVFTKQKRGEFFTKYEEISLGELDPEGRIPDFILEDTTNADIVKKFIAEKKAIVENKSIEEEVAETESTETNGF